MRLVIKSILLKSKMEDLKMMEFKTKTLGELFVAMSDKECNALAELRKLIKEKKFHLRRF